MKSGSDKQLERTVTSTIHRLFWEANLVSPYTLIASFITRLPAMALFNVLIPLQIAFGIEAVIDKNYDRVTDVAWNIAYMTLAYAVLWAIGVLVISHNGSVGAEHLQKKVFANFLRKDYDFYTSTFFGSLGAQATRLRDAYIEYNQLLTLAIPKQIVIITAGVTVIGLQSAWLAIVTIISMALVLGFTLLSSTWRLRYRRKVSELSSDVAGVVGDALTHSPTVKSFASEDYEQQRLTGILGKWRRAQYVSWALSTPADVGRAILTSVAIVALLLMTARMYIAGDVSVAVVALVQLYVIRLIASTLEINEIIKSYEHAMGGAFQPVRTMLIMPEVVDRADTKALPQKPKLDIAFEDVAFGYGDNKDRKAVSHFDLRIAPGERIGLIGYSGSGKTTLTKLLLRFMDIDSGAVRIGGIDIRALSQDELRRHIAYVPQEPLLFHRSIRENIAYGKPAASEAAIRRAARMAHIDAFVAELPDGYDTLVGERGIKLSGGQRQRVAIARAIVKDAPILVLDEATSALDSQSERYIQDALWNLMKGRTSVVIAHRLSTIQRLDRIAVMDKGKIVESGRHDQLIKRRRGVYARLWQQQSGGYIGVPETEYANSGQTTAVLES